MAKDYHLPIIGGQGYKGNKMDGKLCFELWVHRGTTEKASIALQREFNIYNKGKNKRYTAVGVMKAAKSWILDHPDEARAIWEDKYGEIPDELWYDYLWRISSSKAYNSRNAYEKWKAENPEVVKYAESKNL